MAATLTILIILIGCLGFGIYGKISGFPWQKSKAEEEIKMYLKENFSSDMQINKMQYNLMTNNYFARVSPTSADFEFLVSIEKDGSISNDYFAHFWASEIKNDISSKLKNMPANSIRVNIFATPILTKKYANLMDKLPEYTDVLDDLATIDIYCDFPYEFTDGELANLYQVYNVIRTDIPFQSLSFSYSNKVFQFDNADNSHIDNASDLQKYLKDITPKK